MHIVRLSSMVIVAAAVSTFAVSNVSGDQAQAGVPPQLADVAKIGPQVGSAVPEFSLPDHTGTLRTLQSLLAEFAARRGIAFPLLSDQGSEVIKRYGILNTTVDQSNANFGYPFPGTFIIDRRGRVTARFFEPAFQERSTISSILLRLGTNVNVPATKISSPNLEITSYATDQSVATGTRFSVVLDLKPGPRVHVYAPEVQGYKPIAFTIEKQPGLVIGEAQYPRSEDYFFAPLKEHVPVYQSPFRIVQDLTIDASPEGQAALKGVSRVTIKGALNYQACDDKICFSPQSIPLSWTVILRPLDREGAPRP